MIHTKLLWQEGILSVNRDFAILKFNHAYIHEYGIGAVSVSPNTDYCSKERAICSPVTRVFVHHFTHMKRWEIRLMSGIENRDFRRFLSGFFQRYIKRQNRYCCRYCESIRIELFGHSLKKRYWIIQKTFSGFNLCSSSVDPLTQIYFHFHYWLLATADSK